ncbi:uncharacterized protein [Venturia canescens]|uniref:uncharacterized protein n=1 Tax=Venturia canescens TaxID=32260 RepID=UPI001C9D41AF|nr:uncharacterized protein LOC122409568 [Venturia canescens]
MMAPTSRGGASSRGKMSDEIDLEPSVPFSCCNLRVLLPCAHTQMNEDDTETINVDGCSGILSNFLMRIVFVAYAMTTMLVLTQVLLAFFLARIANKSISDELFRKSSQQATSFSYESLDRLVNCGRKKNESFKAPCKTWTSSGKEEQTRITDESVGHDEAISAFSHCSQDLVSTSSETLREREVVARYGTAKIKPSVHKEHRIPTKKPAMRRIR